MNINECPAIFIYTIRIGRVNNFPTPVVPRHARAIIKYMELILSFELAFKLAPFLYIYKIAVYI